MKYGMDLFRVFGANMVWTCLMCLGQIWYGPVVMCLGQIWYGLV